MRHRLKPPTSTARRRGKRTRAALVEEDEVVTVQPAMTSDWPAACEGVLIPELDELLTEEEEGAAGWWKEEERPEDTSLTDLLQQLAASEDDEARPSSTEAALFTMAASSDAARPHPTKMAAGHSNKNALAARLNRQRKKEYVTGLEGRVARLTGDNLRLERERRALGTRVRELEAESRYLRAVLANDSALCQLLGRLTGLGGVRLATSLFRDPQKKPGDHDYALPGLVIKEEEDEEEAAAAPPIGGGVCLHVDREKVSVEFCPACARSAASSVKM